MSDSYFPTVAQAVLKNGYSICAIAPHSKGPRYRGWQEKSLTAEQCQESRFADNGIGILCGMEPNPVIGIDADITDEALANAVFDRWTKDVPSLANATRRWGARPKFLLMVRFEHSRTKEKFGCYVKDGHKVEVEILGKGQQFCALHIHPGTGEPYTWEDPSGEVFGFVGSGCNGDPSTRPLEDLPLLTEADLTQLQRGYKEECEKAGYSLFMAGSENSVAEDDDLIKRMTPLKTPVPGMDLKKAEKLLRSCKFDLGHGSYDTWIKIGMALHHQFQGAPEALALWDRLSFEFPDAYTEGACEAHWKGFKDDRPDIVTLRWAQKVLREQDGPYLHELSQAGLYYRVLHEYGDVLAYDATKKSWMAFENGNWTNRWWSDALPCDFIREVIDHGLTQEANEAADDKTREDIIKFQYQCHRRYSAAVGGVLQMLKTSGALNVSPQDFDTNPRYFGVKGGVIDLETKGFLPGSPEYRVRRYSQVVPDTGAKCPLWEQTLTEWLTPVVSCSCSREACLAEGRAKTAFMKRLLGSALLGKPKEDVFVLIRGNGCNGKSVFLQTIERVFGGYSEAIDQSTIMGSGKMAEAGRARSDIIKLWGSRFVCCPETTQNVTLKEADVKRMTGRDAVTARALYSPNEITFFPTWLLCVVTNYPPTIRGDDDGIWRRVLDIDFPRNFNNDPYAKKDVDLEEKLEKELPGILNWMLDGLWEYQEYGLQIPKCIQERVQDLRSEMDVMGHWMEECLVDCPDEQKNIVGGRELYQSFDAFLVREGEARSAHITHGAFIRRLNKRLDRGRFKRIAGSWRYYGYRLKTEDDEAQEELF